MNLTNEEKKRIGDAATAMMQAFCELKMAEDRLNIASSLSSKLVQIHLPNDVLNGALIRYVDAFKQKQNDFFETLGIGVGNKDFWEWYDRQLPSMDELTGKFKGIKGEGMA